MLTPTDTKQKQQPVSAGIVVAEWTPYQKGESLQGFIDLQLPSGMVLHGCSLHRRGDAKWIGLPGKQFETTDGTKSWVRVISFVDRPTYERFQKSALKAIDEHFALVEAAKKKVL